MAFLSQLQLLLWKNIILRKRQKLRCLVEIIWPLFLFSILMWVRTRGLKQYRHECHYQQKAMPSAGTLPFFQSFVCAFNNTCHRYEVNETTSGVITFDDSIIVRLLDELETIGRDEVKQEQLNGIQHVFSDVKDLATLIRSTVTQEKKINGSLNLRNVIKDPKLLKMKLTKDPLNLTDSVADTIINSDVLIQNISLEDLMSSEPKKYLCDPNYLTSVLSSVTYNDTEKALMELCNLSEERLNGILREVVNELNSTTVLDQMSQFLKHNLGRSLNWNDWYDMINLSRRITQQINSLEAYQDYLNEVKRIGEEYDSILASVQERSDNKTSSFEAIFRYLQLHLCGKNSTDFIEQLKAGGGQSTRFDEIRDQLKDTVQQEGYLYINDSTATAECNEIFKKLESDVVTRYLWNIVKPFVRGKILYAPAVEPVDRVMKIVNDTFAPLANIIRTSEMFLEKYLPALRQTAADNEESFSIIKEYLESSEGNLMSSLGLENSTAYEYDRFANIQNLVNWYLKNNNITNQEEAFDNLESALNDLIKFLECFELDKVQGFDTEGEAVTEGMNLIESNRLWAVISFLGVDDKDNTTSSLPPKVTYKIRIDSSRVDSTKRVEDSITNPGSRRRPAIDLKYITFGFAYLQDMIDGAIISELAGKDRKIPQPGIFLQQFPYPCHIIDQFVLAISRTFPMFMTLSWVYTCAMIVKSIVREKERRLRETMKAMGLRSSALWLSWFIDSFVFMLLVIGLLTAILTKGKVLENSDPSVIFVFITLYAIATITQCFFMSVFFSRANLAAAAGGILFFVTYLPYSFMVQWEERMPTEAKIATSLFSNVAFGFGCSYFAHYEEMGVGIQWSNIYSSPLLGDHYSLIGCAGMFLVDTVLYSVLTWYIETVFPGQYGIPKPWYFPFMRSYWCGGTVGPMEDVATATLPDKIQESKDFEREPTHLQLGVSIQGLTKIYGHSSNKKVALRDLNLNFYQDQITSFLGHNGAGKTTTISILTGLFPPTSGTAKVYGLDIRSNMDNIRKSLGTCPQHNVLFDHLTVKEHLWFYARLRGRPKNEINAEIDEMILDLGLPQKRNELAKNLSGGMQRKLSIAVAFVGGSRTVVLDEPTSGVDPYSRRSIWELLIKYKKGRTVILTTHFMDEADLLGDRIAIISHGRLRCCGSSLFLKARFGKGYYLTVERKELALQTAYHCDIAKEATPSPAHKDKVEHKEGEGDGHETDVVLEADTSHNQPPVVIETKGCEPATTETITQFIRQSVPNAQILEEVGSELLYLLPSKPLEEMENGLSNSRISAKAMENLFDQLDSEMASLGINSYGVSDTTLEEIFLKVTEEGDKVEDGGFETSHGIDVNLSGTGIAKDLKISRWRDLLDLRKMLRKLCTKNSLSYENNLIRESDQDIPTAENGAVNSLALDSESLEHKGRLSLHLDGSKVPVVCSNLGNSTKTLESEEYETLSSNRLLYQQFTALLAKRFHRTKRNPKALFFEIVLPAIFVCLALVFTVLQPGLRQEPPLPLSPWLYGPPNYVFFSNVNPSITNSTAQIFEGGLLGDTGMGAKCIIHDNGKRDSSCRGGADHWYPKPKPDPGNITSPDCSCAIGSQQCPAGAGGPHPPQAEACTGDYMLNMTGRNVSDWLVKTSKDYFKMRYGGFQFGMKNNLTLRVGNLGSLFSNYFSNITQFTDFVNGTRSLFKDKDIYNNIKVWFNNKGWASSVSYMSAISNVVLRASMPEKPGVYSDHYGIQVINHPMNFTDVQMSQELFKQSGISLLHAISVIFALSFVPASFVVFLIEERSSKSKHLQMVSGVHPTIYWIASYAWDSMNYLVSATLCIFIFLAFDEQAYVSEKNIKGLILLLVLYGWASIPLMYPASFLFSIPSSAFVALGCANLFIGIVTTVATFVLEIFDDEELQYIASIIREVFLIFPHFCLGQGLMKMATHHMAQQSLHSLGLEINFNLFEWDFLGKNLFSMFIAGFVFFGLNLAVEYQVLLNVWNKFRLFCRGRQGIPLIEDEEEDVAKERRRVLSNGADDDILRLENLTKVYPSGMRPAVDQLCMGVRWGECFGLLGLNGAGKTTTFKMLTGDTHPTSGNAYVCGRSILPSSKTGCGLSSGSPDGELADVRRRQLGYCPQFDALDPLLTAREHLTLYSRLRGVPSKHVQRLVDEGLKRLGLGRYADRLAGTYSGGNKRKLSTAIALVGDPPLVFLDEPTSGMDVGARRFLWACILSVVRDKSKRDGGSRGRSVVLTSHSMEECEALCSRLTIMVNGRFRCLGSVQHLKDKFGSGYTLIVHCPSDMRAEMVADKLTDRLPPGAILREAHHNRLRFQLPKGTPLNSEASNGEAMPSNASTPIKLSAVFRAMEEAREGGVVEDYSIMQTTLEEVFIRFANEQKDANGVGEEEDGHGTCRKRWIGGGACCYPHTSSVRSNRHKASITGGAV
ncbi:ATP-binding cassette sub-family A member 7-like isoform X2 [Ischnura elegans]|uniref:ATP-binding cassette sub-family A member 7-like isoform X2 n=1 Tax=Ischnura elegans TaxID=197161 RepID=UPI001ED89FED|nr:ATP-binding cassette sub-family A member 7-like isoform X2 [Ischnura elegans]